MSRKSRKKRYRYYIIGALVLIVIFIVSQTDEPDTIIEKSGLEDVFDEPDFVELKDLERIPAGEGTVYSFSLMNHEEIPAECDIIFRRGTESIILSSGIIASKTTKQVIKTLDSDDYQIKIDCQSEDIDISGCENTNFALCKAAKQNKNFIQCLDKDPSYQFFCAALIGKNTSFCDFIEDKSNRVHCYAYVGNDPEQCDTLSEERDWCYEDIAMNTGNSELCSRIDDIDRKNACLSVTNKDVELCKSVKDEGFRFGCIVQLAEKLHDKSLCSFVDDKKGCEDELYHLK